MSIAIRELALREHDPAVRQEVEPREVVRPRQRRRVPPGRRHGHEPRVGPSVRSDVDQPAAVGRDRGMQRLACAARQRLRLGDGAERGELVVQPFDPGAHLFAPRVPLARQRDVVEDAPGQARVAREVLDELGHDVAPVLVEQVLEEQRPVHVASAAAGPLGRVAAGRAEGLEAPLERGRPQHHLVIGAVHPAARGQRRLVPGREPLDHPPRDVRAREGQEGRQPSEQGAEEPAEPPGVVEVEDVGELVDDELLQPVVEVAQREVVGRGPRVEHDAVRRRVAGVAVRDVDVVGQDDVDGASRTRAEPRRQGLVRLLGHDAGPCRQVPEVLGERDAEVLGLEGPPRLVRRHLGRRRARRDEQTGNQRPCGGPPRPRDTPVGRPERPCCLHSPLSSSRQTPPASREARVVPCSRTVPTGRGRKRRASTVHFGGRCHFASTDDGASRTTEGLCTAEAMKLTSEDFAG